MDRDSKGKFKPAGRVFVLFRRRTRLQEEYSTLTAAKRAAREDCHGRTLKWTEQNGVWYSDDDYDIQEVFDA